MFDCHHIIIIIIIIIVNRFKLFGHWLFIWNQKKKQLTIEFVLKDKDVLFFDSFIQIQSDHISDLI